VGVGCIGVGVVEDVAVAVAVVDGEGVRVGVTGCAIVMEPF
jgi:hypothetical protein